MESVVVDQAFWRGKRVLLTGHTGFKGSWLSLWFAKMGATVIGLANSIPTPGLFSAAKIASCVKHVEGDIRQLDVIKQLLLDERPEIVLHMAAQSLVRYSYSNPEETYQTNVMGTLNVLEAIRSTDCVRSCVVVTTDKCYENKEWPWPYRESEAMGGYDPYSSSKACAELLTASYRQSFFNNDHYAQHGTAVATARAGNVIGGGDWALDRLVPDIIHAFSEGRELVLRNPAAVRPWQFVLEPLAGYLILAQQLYQQGPAFAEAWNFGPDETGFYSVQEIVRDIARLWGPEAIWSVDDSAQPHEAKLLKLDSRKARQKLGWRPHLNTAQTLEYIVSWYKEVAVGADAQQLCLEQIDGFERIALQ